MRLPSTVGSSSAYSFPPTVTYPSSLLPPVTSTITHMTHQPPPAIPSTSGYQQTSGHQLQPTSNSLANMMIPNSITSNAFPEQLTPSEVSINSASPVMQQQPVDAENTSPPWNLPIPSGSKINLPTPPSNLQQPSSHHPYGVHAHPPYANAYSAPAFQQTPKHPQSIWYS